MGLKFWTGQLPLIPDQTYHVAPDTNVVSVNETTTPDEILKDSDAGSHLSRRLGGRHATLNYLYR